MSILCIGSRPCHRTAATPKPTRRPAGNSNGQLERAANGARRRGFHKLPIGRVNRPSLKIHSREAGRAAARADRPPGLASVSGDRADIEQRTVPNHRSFYGAR